MRKLVTAASVVPVGLLATQALLYSYQTENAVAVSVVGPTFATPSAATYVPKVEIFSAPVLIEKLELGWDHASRRLAALFQEIDSYRHLADDWDGYGASAPLANALSDMESFIRMLPPGLAIPASTLAASGLPSLYWDERDFFADLEFHGDGECSLYARAKQGAVVDKIFLEMDSPNVAAVSIISELDRLGV